MKRLSKGQILRLHEDLVGTALGVADGSVTFEELRRWLSAHTVETEH